MRAIDSKKRMHFSKIKEGILRMVNTIFDEKANAFFKNQGRNGKHNL
jgi:hypothetical protein